MRPNLPPVAVADRITRLRASLAAEGADAILVTRLPNVRYLTGFTGSAGLLLVTAEDAIFVTDGRYREQAGEQLDAAGATIEIGIGVAEGDQREHLRRVVARAGVRRLLLEAHGVSWAQARSYDEEWFPEVEVVAGPPIVEQLRMVKEPGEIERIRAACAIADDALDALLRRLVGVGIVSLTSQPPNLEEIFLRYYGGGAAR